MSQLVPTQHVIPAGSSFPYTIRKMERVLNTQGQIEPLQVRHCCTREDGTVVYITFEQDAHGSDIVNAATALGWSTLLVVVVDRYQS